MLSDTSPTVPSYDRMMYPTLQALKALGGSATNEELLSKVIEKMQLSDAVVALIHTDNRSSRVAYNLAWAKTYLKKVGAVESGGRGVWALTAAGEALSANDVAKIPGIVRKQEVRRGNSDASMPETSAQAIQSSEPPPEDSWRNLVLSALQKMEPSAFERLAQRLLREAGFTKVEVTGRSGDGGIDGVGVLRLGLLSFQTLFQCKRYQGTVGAGAVRDFRGAMVGRSDKGLVITTGTFSGDARREATRDGAPPIELIDGEELCTLLKNHRVGVRTELVEQVVVDVAWFATI